MQNSHVQRNSMILKVKSLFPQGRDFASEDRTPKNYASMMAVLHTRGGINFIMRYMGDATPSRKSADAQ